MKKMITLAVLAMGFATSAHAENLLCQNNYGQFVTQGEFYSKAANDSRAGYCVVAQLQRRGADEVRVYQNGRKLERYSTNENQLQILIDAARMGCAKVTCNGNMDINVGAPSHGHRH